MPEHAMCRLKFPNVWVQCIRALQSTTYFFLWKKEIRNYFNLKLCFTVYARTYSVSSNFPNVWVQCIRALKNTTYFFSWKRTLA